MSDLKDIVPERVAKQEEAYRRRARVARAYRQGFMLKSIAKEMRLSAGRIQQMKDEHYSRWDAVSPVERFLKRRDKYDGQNRPQLWQFRCTIISGEAEA